MPVARIQWPPAGWQTVMIVVSCTSVISQPLTNDREGQACRLCAFFDSNEPFNRAFLALNKRIVEEDYRIGERPRSAQQS